MNLLFICEYNCEQNPLCSKYRNRVTVYRGCLSFCQKIRIIELNQYLSNYSENNFIVIGQLNTDHYSHLNETKQNKILISDVFSSEILANNDIE
ncbi:hypothetical protein T4D_11900 [Trichinella pseudospiralis]|uniref:Uncharacterized protein n=1 Tax=Trichinella pseudospiralis TaxID=6337 RepID=A0A0V1G211_TRIPS|nr:hypothetical protein T4D_11900 [Trichinella pseudospiralis]